VSAMMLLQFVLSLLRPDYLLNTVAVLLLLGRTETQYLKLQSTLDYPGNGGGGGGYG